MMADQHCLMVIALYGMVWSFGLELFRPVRKYVMRRTYFKRFRRMLKDSSNNTEKDKADQNSCCPSCRLPFDKGKKRKLIDTCGHQRCYTCIFTTDHCPLCQPQAPPKASLTRRPSSHLFPRHVPAQVRPNTISIDNKQQLAQLAKKHAITPYVAQTISSRWTEGDLSCANQEISTVEVHQSQMDYEMSEISVSKKPSFLTRNKEKINSKVNANSAKGTKNDILDKSCLAFSESPRKDILSTSRQTLRSREQSMSSLMSISSRSSSAPMDMLKEIDERVPSSSTRFSFMQSSNISLDLSSEAPSTSSAEKVTTIPLRLKPLYFEVPQPEADPTFSGRHWLFKEIEKCMAASSEVAGILITGRPGTGKTSLILQLVDYSSFGRKWDETVYQNTQDIYWKIRDLASTCSDGDQMSISSRGSSQPNSGAVSKDSVHHLASRVVGYHFCQAEYDSTCSIPDFVHSLAAQLCQAPQLVDYRDLLLKEPRYQNLLCLDSCLADPDTAFTKGILEPLNISSPTNSFDRSTCIIVIDSLHESDTYRSATDENIANFLAKHLPLFPQWLKIILTARTGCEGILSSLSLKNISLDMSLSSFNVHQDLLCYIQQRINSSKNIQSNINNICRKDEENVMSRFIEHLASISNGSFLYLKLTLDLLHKGYLVIKSTSFNVLPVNLHEVFMLTFNLQFSSASTFDKVNPILEVCLASLYPLTALEVYHSLNARYKAQSFSWFEFLQRVEILTTAQILVHRQDGSLMICHPSMREWLIARDSAESKKFLCNCRYGHICLTLRMARLESPLSPLQGLELSHHLLKAKIFKNDCSRSELGTMQSSWLQHCLLDTTGSLVHERNIFSPDIMVSRLLLQAGANPNVRLGSKGELPLLTMAAHLGFEEFVSLLLEFGADCNVKSSDDGITPLMAACKRGHQTIVQVLLSAGAKGFLKDNEGRTAVLFAAENGYLSIIVMLLATSWPDPFSFTSAVTSAFVAAAGKGHLEVCQYLLKETDVQVNACDPVTSHTALTMANWQGHINICKFLLQNAASLVAPSLTGAPPVIWAVRSGRTEIVEMMIKYHACLTQTDREGRTPLMWASMENNVKILDVLIQQGVSINAKDFEGRTALAWACYEDKTESAQLLLEKKADIECLDMKGRTPLSLAVKHDNGRMVILLLKHGANMEHRDYGGNSPLDEAIRIGNLAVVSKLLHQGVKIGPKIWCAAQGQPSMLLIFLHKLLSDGVVLYKKDKLQEASQRFQYALKKFPPVDMQGEKKAKFIQLKFYLQLGLARCDRKMKEFDSSIQAADEALKIKPKSFEALYVRAKTKHEAGMYQEALDDVTQALHEAQSDSRVIQTLQNLRAEILTSSKIVCPLDGTDMENSRSIQRLGGNEIIEQAVVHTSLCRNLVDRQQSDVRLSLAEKKLSFCGSSEVALPVH